MRKKNKAIIAMSGGIDSSVAAALLKTQGFDVIGVFMKLWKSSKQDEKRARLVAEKLGISFYVFNFEKEFKKKIVDCFLREYKAGLTPNPCVVCNKEIKFNFLFKKLLSLDADFIATGHYARKKGDKLLKAKDKNKDQSYFLWKLNQKLLKKTLFPIGSYSKNEVKKLTKKFKLPVINISESQEVCFIHTTINDFLKKHLKTKLGKIIDVDRKLLGEHQGLWFYTIGQRKGIELSGGPFYVLDKDIKKNLLIVTKNEKDLYKKELIAKNVNWISGKSPKLPLRIKAKIRYGHNSGLAVIVRQGRMYKVIFSKTQKAITPGQTVAFYNNQELLGGGIISA